MAARAHSRDGKRDDQQIVFGLVCSAEGCPIAVEVFKGNTAGPTTVAAQVTKLKERFGIAHLALVGDRGMLTSARIEQVLKPEGMDWVSVRASHLDGKLRPALILRTRPTSGAAATPQCGWPGVSAAARALP